MHHLIKLISFEKQTVLDPFMRSGSTGIGCLDLNRDFIGYELEETYFNIAKQRMENKKMIWNIHYLEPIEQ